MSREILPVRNVSPVLVHSSIILTLCQVTHKNDNLLGSPIFYLLRSSEPFVLCFAESWRGKGGSGEEFVGGARVPFRSIYNDSKPRSLSYIFLTNLALYYRIHLALRDKTKAL